MPITASVSPSVCITVDSAAHPTANVELQSIAFEPDTRAFCLTTRAGVERLVQSHKAGSVNLHRYHCGPMGEPLDALQFWAMLPQLESDASDISVSCRRYVTLVNEHLAIIRMLGEAGLTVSSDTSRPFGSALAYGLLFGDLTETHLCAFLGSGASLFDPVPTAYADFDGPVCINLLELIFRRERLAHLRETALSDLKLKLPPWASSSGLSQPIIKSIVMTGFRAGSAELILPALSEWLKQRPLDPYTEELKSLFDSIFELATPEMLKLMARLHVPAQADELALALSAMLGDVSRKAYSTPDGLQQHCIELAISKANLADIPCLLSAGVSTPDSEHSLRHLNALLLALRREGDYARMLAVAEFLSGCGVAFKLCDELVQPDSWREGIDAFANRRGQWPVLPASAGEPGSLHAGAPDSPVMVFDVYGSILRLNYRHPDQHDALRQHARVRATIAQWLDNGNEDVASGRFRMRFWCLSALVSVAAIPVLSYMTARAPNATGKGFALVGIVAGSAWTVLSATVLFNVYLLQRNSERKCALYQNVLAWVDGVVNAEV